MNSSPNLEQLLSILQYGVLVFRSTSLNDKRHVEFAKRFGELDDIKPYLAAGRKNRLAYDELFDVSNLDLDGTVVESEAPRAQANKVRKKPRYPLGLIPLSTLC